MNQRLGFTLVEVLVVISIISVLAAILFGSFSDARDNASNRALQTELKEIQLALEIYKAQNGQYPPIGATSGACRNDSGNPNFAFTGFASCNNFATINRYIGELSPDYIATLPAAGDSRNSSCIIRYEVEDSTQGWYKLTAENCFAGAEAADEGIGEDEEFSRCPSTCGISPGTCNSSTYGTSYVQSADFYESMAVYSFGGECQ